MSIHDEIMKNMTEMSQKFGVMGIALDLPPPSNKALGTVYVDVDMGKTLSAKFPFNPNFTNPVKMFQGGMIGAAFDEVFGPLTYMAAAKPVVTLEMSTSFVRPFTAKDEHMIIAAEVVAKTKSVILLKGEAKTKDGKLLATATSHSLIMSEANLKQVQ